MIKIKTLIFLLGITILFSTSFFYKNTNIRFPSDKDFFRMEGTLMRHPFLQSEDSLSDKEVLELQDNNGLTIWFGRYFYKDICVSGICRMVKLWIFWDGAGGYLGYQLKTAEPLTKADHIDFLPKDYQRLHEILSDTASILKTLKYEDLTDSVKTTEPSIFEVDGYSSATKPALSEYIIKDAVFTCYTLYHTVYGESQAYINRILHGRATPVYIRKLFQSDDIHQRLALRFIQQHPTLLDEFQQEAMDRIRSENKEIAQKALSLFSKENLHGKEAQISFIDKIDDALPGIKYEIIYTMQSQDTLFNESAALLLDKYLNGFISEATLMLIYKMITPEMLQDATIMSQLHKIATSSNKFASNSTIRFLERHGVKLHE